MAVTPEGKVKEKVSAAIDRLRLRYRFMPVPTGYGKRTLDYLCCIGGYFVAVETKKDCHSPLTRNQKITKDEIEAAGGLVFVVYDDITLQRMVVAMRLLCDNPRPDAVRGALWA